MTYPPNQLEHKCSKDTRNRVVLIVTCLFLSACGGGPSKSDVANALKQQAQALAGMLGATGNTDNVKVDVGDITKQSDGSYVAIVSVNGVAGTIKMAKVNGGWQVLETH